MNKYDAIEKMADKIIKNIKKMYLSKTILRSLDFKNLIEEMLFQVDKKHLVKGDDYYYYFYDYIIEKYTNLSTNDANCLWYCHKNNDYQELFSCISNRNYFNQQMAEYFNKNVWDEEE